jgi:hypothetical protein
VIDRAAELRRGENYQALIDRTPEFQTCFRRRGEWPERRLIYKRNLDR